MEFFCLIPFFPKSILPRSFSSQLGAASPLLEHQQCHNHSQQQLQPLSQNALACVSWQGSPACRALWLKNLLGFSGEFLCPYDSGLGTLHPKLIGLQCVKREDGGGDWKDGHQLQFEMEQALKKAVCPLLLGSSRHGWLNLMESTVFSQAVKREEGIFCQLKTKKIYLGCPNISNFSVLPRMLIDESMRLHQAFQ